MTPLELARAFLQKGDEDKVLLSKLVTATEVSESISDFKYSKPPRSTSRQSSQWMRHGRHAPMTRIQDGSRNRNVGRLLE